ncbi:hypothetical protein HYC85_024280 [Camellia sinensis]|uniref:Uncharacterized protein n=1 Tax=Camellia sinensis TaxID=4442 RepID=A0A7J7GBK0_CAMSI|nr:hypothetical protein HYC85_024280 [Camellia sinensis]
MVERRRRSKEEEHTYLGKSKSAFSPLSDNGVFVFLWDLDISKAKLDIVSSPRDRGLALGVMQKYVPLKEKLSTVFAVFLAKCSRVGETVQRILNDRPLNCLALKPVKVPIYIIYKLSGDVVSVYGDEMVRLEHLAFVIVSAKLENNCPNESQISQPNTSLGGCISAVTNLELGKFYFLPPDKLREQT